MFPEDTTPVAPLRAPAALTLKVDPLITVGPVVVPRVRVPVPFAATDKPVFRVDGVIAGEAPLNVKAVEERVLVLMVPVVERF